MKKLHVTVNGVTYEVEVEVIEDDEDASGSYGFSATNIYSQQSAPPPAAAPAAAPAASPAAAPSAPPPAPSSGGGNTLTSPLPGVVKKINVKPGDAVKANDTVMVIEAMKMETSISSPVDGTIKAINVSLEQSVQQGEVLATFE